MTAPLLTVGGTTLLASLLVGALLFRPPRPADPRAIGARSPSPAMVREPEATRITAESLTPVVLTDPFRVSRAPAAVAYDPVDPAPTPSAPPVRPVWVVTGILWGRRPVAFVEGAPGQEASRLVAVDDTLAGYRIRRIEPHAVVIRGPDTTWVVPLREPWQ